ncbi:hypothetical protein SAMN06296065_102341 [Novosphingobium panipatense]|uniref:Uncharacterized protein n=2 Tax=Novosphingobium panipatense TaxID=428991 RepID=A0ABY1Q453_9SPHN|nr:hypothetical protein SAMN06296065_102341 [Novosphingobium panipatense]
MPRRVGARRSYYLQTGPLRQIAVTRKPAGDRISRFGHLPHVPSGSAARENGGRGLTDGAGMAAHSETHYAAFAVKEEAEDNGTAATAGAGLSANRQVTVKRVTGQFNGKAKDLRRVKNG